MEGPGVMLGPYLLRLSCARDQLKPGRHPEKAKAPAGTDRQGPTIRM
jgi:hypothetical protein